MKLTRPFSGGHTDLPVVARRSRHPAVESARRPSGISPRRIQTTSSAQARTAQ